MATGLSAAFATSQLNVFRGTSHTAPAGVYVKLHTGDPGAAGTANPSAVTTRNQATFSAPSGNAIALSALAPWSMTGAETITHLSMWDASTGGNFLGSVALASAKSVVATDTLTVTSLTISKTSVAS